MISHQAQDEGWKTDKPGDGNFKGQEVLTLRARSGGGAQAARADCLGEQGLG